MSKRKTMEAEEEYGAHIERIQEDWWTREEPYGYEREVYLYGRRVLDIRQHDGVLCAQWFDVAMVSPQLERKEVKIKN